jgi:hypothetical protein
MIEIKSTDTPSEEREPLFSIDGREYTIPKEVPGNLSLQAIERMRTESEYAVIAWIMETMLGKAGYRALLDCKAVKPSQLRAITEICRSKMMGELEEEGKG